MRGGLTGARRHVTADQTNCDDVGRDSAGSVFPEEPAQVRTWAFESYSPAQVLGVPYGKNSFGVFIADTVGDDAQRRIYADLSKGQ